MAAPLSKSQQLAVLIGAILASSMAFIDSTALNVILPSLQRELGIDGTQLLWVVNGYAMFLSALLLVGGALGDLYGRKRMFIIGIIIFTIASILCGIANSSMTLIVARCVQGIGGALMVPGSLSLISALFPEEKRGWAIGTWSMFSALTTVIGPLLGGLLADAGLWRAVFFINVPIAIISLAFLITKSPESKSPDTKKLDLLGTFLAVVALAGLTFGFIEVPDFGFDDYRIQISLMIGAGALIAFLIHEYRTGDAAMMPLSLFRSPIFSTTNLITLLVYAALGGLLFFFPLNLIQVQGYSPKIAGATMLPFGLLIAFLSRISGAWSDRVGVRPPLIIGPAITAVGFYMFSLPSITDGPSSFVTTFLPPILLVGIGMGITVAPLTTAVMNSVSVKYTGTASGVNNTIARSAGVLAVAIMGATALINFQNSMTTKIETMSLSTETKEELIDNLPKLAETQAPETATPDQKLVIGQAIKLSFVEAFNQLALIASILAGSGALIAYFFIKRDKVKTSTT